MASGSAAFHITITFWLALLIHAQRPPDVERPSTGVLPPLRPGVADSEDLNNLLMCPRRSDSGESGSGSGSGNGSASGESLDERSEVEDFGTCQSGSDSGSGSGDVCSNPLYNRFCYSLANVTEVITAHADVNATNTEEAREAACVFSASEVSCRACSEFVDRCGDPLAINDTTVCEDTRIVEECARRGPNDCFHGARDPVFCDMCALFADICQSTEIAPLARCNAFGFRALMGCKALNVSSSNYSCECFAPALSCSFCSSVINECSGAEPSLPPGILQQLGTLTSEEVENAVTMGFTGLTRVQFLINDLTFRTAIADAVNGLNSGGSDARKRQAEVTTPDDVHYIAPCPCENGDNVIVDFYVSGSTEGSVIDAALVMQAADEVGEELATEIGAEAYAGATTSDLQGDGTRDDDDDDDLSDGEIAAVVVVVGIVAIVTALAIALVFILVFRRRESHKHEKERKKIALQ